MVCGRCGSRLYEEERYCENCGSSVRWRAHEAHYEDHDDEDYDPVYRLPAPEMPWVDRGFLCWEYVDDASGYVVLLNGRKVPGKLYEPELDLRRLRLGRGSFVLQVAALGDGVDTLHSPPSKPLKYGGTRRRPLGLMLGLVAVALFLIVQMVGLLSGDDISDASLPPQVTPPEDMQEVLPHAEIPPDEQEVLPLAEIYEQPQEISSEVLSPEEIHEFERMILELTNIERANVGSPPLVWCDMLAAAARDHNIDMIENDFFAHEGSDGSSQGDRIGRRGFDWVVAAENLIAGPRTPETAVQGWMDSPGHRVNILSPDLTHLGVGLNISPSPSYRFFWGQKFAVERQ